MRRGRLVDHFPEFVPEQRMGVFDRELFGIPMKLVLQWGIPAIAILLLLAFKYGKPRGYLGDWWRYQTRPHIYCGLERDSQLNVSYLSDFDGE